MFPSRCVGTGNGCTTGSAYGADPVGHDTVLKQLLRDVPPGTLVRATDESGDLAIRGQDGITVRLRDGKVYRDWDSRWGVECDFECYVEGTFIGDVNGRTFVIFPTETNHAP